RMFGLTGPEGNHGEDCKECYYYLDSTPTHSYMKALYKYPQAEFPYARLADENRRRGKGDPELELIDTGVFDGNRYFDVFAENESNTRKLYDTDNWTPYVKDAFHEYLIHGKKDAVNPKQVGTKVAAHYKLEIPAGGEVVLRFRLSNVETNLTDFDQIFAQRI